jgi:hypothetical protein
MSLLLHEDAIGPHICTPVRQSPPGLLGGWVKNSSVTFGMVRLRSSSYLVGQAASGHWYSWCWSEYSSVPRDLYNLYKKTSRQPAYVWTSVELKKSSHARATTEWGRRKPFLTTAIAVRQPPAKICSWCPGYRPLVLHLLSSFLPT